jgi:hypothetical protein
MSPSANRQDIGLLQQLLDRAMRPGDPVTLDAWTCAAESVLKTRPSLAEPPPEPESPRDA